MLTSVELPNIPHLDPVLIQRSITFAERVATLNRNRNYVGETCAPIALVTHDMRRVKKLRPEAKIATRDNVVGMCWCGSYHWGPTVIWLRVHGADGRIRHYDEYVETFLHELAHSQTSDKHGHTFRRMYALLAPHVLELFQSSRASRWSSSVDSIIMRYQSNRVTERIGLYVGDPIETVFPRRRRQEEIERHKTASERMRDRLVRHGVKI